MAKIRLDVIGCWTELKLDIVRKYAAAYSTILNRRPEIRRHIYIDAFSGPGVHISKATGEPVPGSPSLALHVKPRFTEYHFIDLDGDKADSLRGLARGHRNVHVYEGDCNEILTQEVFPRCRYEDFNRALCLLDPYALDVRWEVLQRAGQMRSVEIFYSFMIMDANMNILHRNPRNVSPEQLARMDAAWGDRSWQNEAYKKSKGLFDQTVEDKADNPVIAEAFRKRLQSVAGFKFVPPPMPMKNKNGSVVYYLYFASPNETGAEIVAEIFNTYRDYGES